MRILGLAVTGDTADGAVAQNVAGGGRSDSRFNSPELATILDAMILERLAGAHDERVLAMLGTLVRVSESRTRGMDGHSERVATLATLLAQELGLDAADVRRVRIAGELHDIGMVGVPERLLRSEGPLLPEEVGFVEAHVNVGATLLREGGVDEEIVRYVYEHHERFDGRGYPRGIAGSDISLGGRILAVADVWDALLSDRPYRARLSFADALGFVQVNAGLRFDPDVCQALREVVSENHGYRFI